MTLREVLHKPGEPIGHVYFPGGSFCSIVTLLEDGSMVEVATVGREGMVGTSAVLAGSPSQSATMVQGESATCYRMTAEDFRREMDRRGAFYELLTHYAVALNGFIMQSTDPERIALLPIALRRQHSLNATSASAIRLADCKRWSVAPD